MGNVKLIVCESLLIAASLYGLIGGAAEGKKFAMAGLALYLICGGLGLATEMVSNNSKLSEVDDHVCYITNVGGVDLLMTDVCILSGVDKNLALINLIPPVIDLFLRYALDNRNDQVTQFTHIFSVALFFFFAFRDAKYVLIGSGIAFLLSIFGTRNGDRLHVDVMSAFGVFFTSWFLGGKDVKDFGITD